MSVPHNPSYERAVIEQESDRLTYYTQRANLEQEQTEENMLFVNLSIKQIFEGISRTFINLINEIVSGQVKSFNQLLIAVFREDRMIYIGVLLVFIAFAIYLTDITS